MTPFARTALTYSSLLASSEKTVWLPYFSHSDVCPNYIIDPPLIVTNPNPGSNPIFTPTLANTGAPILVYAKEESPITVYEMLGTLMRHGIGPHDQESTSVTGRVWSISCVELGNRVRVVRCQKQALK